MFQKEIDLGRIKQGTTNKLTFLPEDQIFDVVVLKPGCMCTHANWNSKKNQVEVTFVPNSISKALLANGYTEYNTTKTVTVQFKNKEGIQKTNFIEIKATITQ